MIIEIIIIYIEEGIYVYKINIDDNIIFGYDTIIMIIYFKNSIFLKV